MRDKASKHNLYGSIGTHDTSNYICITKYKSSALWHIYLNASKHLCHVIHVQPQFQSNFKSWLGMRMGNSASMCTGDSGMRMGDLAAT
jgi:hypothetical protein